MSNNLLNLKPVKIEPINLFGSNQRSKPVRRPIDRNIRSLVWQRYNGNSLSGKCYVCKRPITHDHFEIGHNKAAAKGGSDNIQNLRPICAPCNRGMGTMSIEQYKKKYFGKPSKKKPVSSKPESHKKSKEDYWINPLTGRKEKVRPLFRF